MRSISGQQLARDLGNWPETGGTGPAYSRLAAAIRLLVLDGRLPLETRLPSERELSTALRVSRTTVTTAYDELRGAGYAASRQGSGTWTTVPTAGPAGATTAAWAPFGPDRSHGEGRLDLAHAAPEAPTGILHEAYAVALKQLPRHLPTSGYDLFGLPELRSAIAERFRARGLATTPEQVLVTAGTQHAFALVLSVLTDPGDRVLIDHPTYPNAIDAIRRAATRPVPVPLRNDGWDVDALAAAVRQSAPRLAYLIPDFQNPTGLLAGVQERASMAAELARSRTVTVIDETHVDLALDVSAPPPFAGHLPPDAAVTIGGVSKSVWGGMRIGWIRADEAIVRRLAAARASFDMSSPVVEQLAAAEVLRRHDEFVAHTCDELRRRRDTLAGAVAEHLPQWSFRLPAGGLVLWCDIGVPASSRLVSAAEQYGIRLAAGPRFGVDGAFERRLRLPYVHPADVLQQAVPTIAAAFHAAIVATGPQVDVIA